MRSSRISEVTSRRDKMYIRGHALPKYYTYNDALIELHEAYKANSAEKLDEAFDHLAYTIKRRDIESVVSSDMDCDKYPTEIRRWLRNIARWFTLSEHKSRYLDDLILATKKIFLEVDLYEYVYLVSNYCNILKEITLLDWQFDGIDLVSSPSNDWQEDNPERPKKCANKMIEILITRGVLSGIYNETTHSAYGLGTSDYLWRCQVLKPELLQTIKRVPLLSEMLEASMLISEITNKPCDILNLHDLDAGNHYRVLEVRGIIKAREYYAFNVEICDYDLAKLRSLVADNKTIEDIWEEAEKVATPSANPSSMNRQSTMKIAFHLGGYREVSTISFFEIMSMNRLQLLKRITEKSGFLYNAFGEDECFGVESPISTHTLTIYLPHDDKQGQPYGNFEYLFQHEKYQAWKSQIEEAFPELKTQFTQFERKAKGAQELYRIRGNIRNIRERFTTRHKPGLFSQDVLDEAIAADVSRLEARESELSRELYPDDMLRRMRS